MDDPDVDGVLAVMAVFSSHLSILPRIHFPDCPRDVAVRIRTFAVSALHSASICSSLLCARLVLVDPHVAVIVLVGRVMSPDWS